MVCVEELSNIYIKRGRKNNFALKKDIYYHIFRFHVLSGREEYGISEEGWKNSVRDMVYGQDSIMGNGINSRIVYFRAHL